MDTELQINCFCNEEEITRFCTHLRTPRNIERVSQAIVRSLLLFNQNRLLPYRLHHTYQFEKNFASLQDGCGSRKPRDINGPKEAMQEEIKAISNNMLQATIQNLRDRLQECILSGGAT
ncbi:hypothetical protein ANN_27339 [Periplaneta americana]|uniref:Uncharacterized protein n=1 Tax=Periplaneta americana TaxID=6978 RepID=A0ABQ8RYB2_PERAM|nr:hypothetical protein ANN_27339 [Periplaneta americana]